jgi:hypothetical protein
MVQNLRLKNAHRKKIEVSSMVSLSSGMKEALEL